MSGDATPLIELKNYLNRITGKDPKKDMEVNDENQSEDLKCEKDVHAEGDAGRESAITAAESLAEDVEEDPNAMYEDTLFKLSEGKQLMAIILKIMAACDKPTEEIDLETFRQIMFKTMNLSQYFMIDRVFRMFDGDGDGKITPLEYISVLSTLLRGSLEDHISFAFKVYDNENQGFLTMADVSRCLEESSEKVSLPGVFPGRKMPAEINDGLCDLIFPKMDLDRDGKISLDEFRTACTKDPTLVETFGPCLPKDSWCPLSEIRKQAMNDSKDSLDYLMKTSSMSLLCTPVRTEVDRVLKPIDILPTPTTTTMKSPKESKTKILKAKKR